MILSTALTDIKIAKAIQDDIPGILKLYSQKEIDNGDILDIKEAIKIFNKFELYPSYFLYVVKLDQKIIGTFELLIMDNLAHKGKPSAIVEDVVVDESCRSQGIGKKMMEFAMNISKSYGCYKLTLSSSLNRKRAHEFYESLGFNKHGYSFLIKT